MEGSLKSCKSYRPKRKRCTCQRYMRLLMWLASRISMHRRCSVDVWTEADVLTIKVAHRSHSISRSNLLSLAKRLCGLI
jgi:hypothetical protein